MKYNKHQSKCKCNCGNIVIVSNDHLKNGHTRSCGCIAESYGSKKIKAILLENNINFVTEYCFNDLVSSNHGILRFDFAIFENNKLIQLIEFDGKQHYEECYGFYTGELNNIQQRDELKNQYCKEHNIKLVRVPYYDIDKISLEYLDLS